MVEILALLAGGGTGLIGSVVGRVAGFFEQKQKFKQQLAEYDHELKLLGLQQQQRTEEREHEADITEYQEDTKTLTASMQHDTSYGDSLLRWVRPVLTLLLVALVFTIYLTTSDLDIKGQVVAQVLFLTSTAFSWWFADRSGRNK